MAWLSVLSVLLVLQGGAAFLTPKSIIQSRHVLKMADDVKPVTDKSRATSAFKQFGASAGVFGLIFGKKLLDGPVYDEKTSLGGKTVVITGGNTGLGKEAAVKLAALGAEVIILCRNPSNAQAAVTEIKERSGSTLVASLPLDLADLDNIATCSDKLKSFLGPKKINVLMNNAGIMALPSREKTKDGFEMQFGVNHLGHFALTSLLLQNGLLSRGEDGKEAARIINVSSTAHLLGNLEGAREKEDLMLTKAGAYEPWPAYGNSKLANILFTRELAERIKDKSPNGKDISTYTLHPGSCRTELGRYIFDIDSIPKALYPVLGVIASPLLYVTKSSEQGAQTQIFLAASQTIDPAKDSGKYYDNSAEAGISDAAKDADTAKWLWSVSETLTGLKLVV